MYKSKRSSLPVDCQFARLQSQWENGRNGNGAWFWQHFKPVLSKDSAGNPKDLHLQCEHCGKFFSARNPSRTSLEHLKSGACSVFRATAAFEAVKATPRNPGSVKRTRKQLKKDPFPNDAIYRKLHSNLSDVLSSERATQNRVEIEECLIRFFLEASDSVPVTLVQHPRILELCTYLGIQPISPHSLLTSCLDRRVLELQEDTTCRLREAGFYQGTLLGTEDLLDVFLNLPDGGPIFIKRVEVPDDGALDPNFLLEVMSTTMEELESTIDRRSCLGWIIDTKSTTFLASELMDASHPSLVNIPCQISALKHLIKDFIKHIPILKETLNVVKRIIDFANENPGLLPKISEVEKGSELELVCALEAVFELRVELKKAAVVHHHSNIPSDGIDVIPALLDFNFWSCIEESRSLFNPILESIQTMESSQSYLSQILDLWLNLESYLTQMSGRDLEAYSSALPVFKDRFEKSYHPAMAAAFVLDPAFCIKQETGFFTPNWNRLNTKQQDDVCFLIKKLIPSNRCNRVLTDFSLWQNHGLPESYKSVVYDPVSPTPVPGIGFFSNVVPISLRKAPWTSCLKDLEALGPVALRLLSMRGSIKAPRGAGKPPLKTNGTSIETKLLFVSSNARLASNNLLNEQKRDQDLLEAVSKERKRKKLKNEEQELNSGENFEFPNQEDGQLYLQQLNIGETGVLEMTPPPLGTLPELGSNEAAAAVAVAVEETQVPVQDLKLDEIHEQKTEDTKNEEFRDGE